MADGTLTSPAQASPSPVDLRPLTTSELIDRGFTLYRNHFTGFLLIALLGQTAPLLGEIVITGMKLSPTKNDLLTRPLMFFGMMGLLLCVRLLAMVIVFGFSVAVTFYISDAYLGKVPSVADSLKKLTLRLGRTAWTCLANMVLIALTFLFPIVVFFAAVFYYAFNPPIQFGAMLLYGLITGLMFLLSLAPVLIVFMRLMLTTPVLALEGRSGWKSIRRSAALVRYDPGLGILYWGEMRLSFLLLPLFIIELLSLALTGLPLVIFEISETLRNGSLGQLVAPPDSTVIISQIVTYLVGALIWPLYSIAITLFYYDVRIRREGFDLEFMASHLETGK